MFSNLCIYSCSTITYDIEDKCIWCEEWFGLWISIYYIIFSIHVLYVFAPTNVPKLLSSAMVELLVFLCCLNLGPNIWSLIWTSAWDLAGLLVSDGEDFLCCVMYFYFSTQPIRSLLHRIYICFLWFFNCEGISTITLCKNILIHSLTFLYIFFQHCKWPSARIQTKLHIWARCLRLANLSSYGKTLFFKHIFFLHRCYIPELLL